MAKTGHEQQQETDGDSRGRRTRGTTREDDAADYPPVIAVKGTVSVRLSSQVSDMRRQAKGKYRAEKKEGGDHRYRNTATVIQSFSHPDKQSSDGRATSTAPHHTLTGCSASIHKTCKSSKSETAGVSACLLLTTKALKGSEGIVEPKWQRHRRLSAADSFGYEEPPYLKG